jgi:hypothetical protein
MAFRKLNSPPLQAARASYIIRKARTSFTVRPGNSRCIVKLAGVLSHRTVSRKGSYQGMSAHHQATTGGAGIGTVKLRKRHGYVQGP